MSSYRNVLLPKCQLPKRPLPKCPLLKCLDTSAYTDLLPANPVLETDHNHCSEPVKLEVDRCQMEMSIHAAASNDPTSSYLRITKMFVTEMSCYQNIHYLNAWISYSHSLFIMYTYQCTFIYKDYNFNDNLLVTRCSDTHFNVFVIQTCIILYNN